MKKTIWKRILCAVLVTLTACVLCTGAFAAKYTCIKSGCTREAAKGSAYCWVHKPTKSNSSVSGSGSRPSGSSSTKHKYTCIQNLAVSFFQFTNICFGYFHGWDNRMVIRYFL